VTKDLKRPIKCYVKEAYPYFLVTDGYFFVAAYFTKEAVAEFHQKFPNVNIVDLADKVMVITNWTLEMRRVNSAEVFTSYANLEVRLIVHSFKPNLQERLNPTRFPTNLFRDAELKTIIQHFRHQAIQVSYCAFFLFKLIFIYSNPWPSQPNKSLFQTLPSLQLMEAKRLKLMLVSSKPDQAKVMNLLTSLSKRVTLIPSGFKTSSSKKKARLQ
jgi:hypothetical protein